MHDEPEVLVQYTQGDIIVGVIEVNDTMAVEECNTYFESFVYGQYEWFLSASFGNSQMNHH